VALVARTQRRQEEEEGDSRPSKRAKSCILQPQSAQNMNSSNSSGSLLGLSSKGEGSSSASNGSGVSHSNGGSGSSNTNGHSNGLATVDIPHPGDVFKPLYEGSRLDRTEYIRITLQSLKELGFE
jgi:hypothetical protein